MSNFGTCLAVAAALVLASEAAAAPAAPISAASTAQARVLRQMQIHKVADLGLEIWVENQPVWETQLSAITGNPTFVAQSPEGYHPPTVMTYTSFPKEKVPTANLAGMASSAIQRASQNFGLNIAQARNLDIVDTQYGSLIGFEARFKGLADKVPMDVVVFVGQAPGKFPVALSVYTLRGKMGNLDEHRRRAWGKLKYLPR